MSANERLDVHVGRRLGVGHRKVSRYSVLARFDISRAGELHRAVAVDDPHVEAVPSAAGQNLARVAPLPRTRLDSDQPLCPSPLIARPSCRDGGTGPRQANLGGRITDAREVLRCGKRRRMNGRCLSIRLTDDAPRQHTKGNRASYDQAGGPPKSSSPKRAHRLMVIARLWRAVADTPPRRRSTGTRGPSGRRYWPSSWLTGISLTGPRGPAR